MAEVLSAQRDGYHAPATLRRSATSQTFLVASASTPSFSRSPTLKDAYSGSLPSSAPSSARSSQINLSKSPSFISSGPSSFSLDGPSDDEDDIEFPSYGRNSLSSDDEELEAPASPRTENSYTIPSSSDATSTHSSSTPEPLPMSEDDTAIRQEPSRHVDYLSHDWREEDIAASWRHIVSKRRLYGQRSRLENASWRTWAKSKYKLSTVSPETLNWLKDCDVTWLYGPLQTATNTLSSQSVSEPPSQLSKSNSFLNKKPILKKRSMSEVMLQRSISASSLVKQAAAAVQAQQGSGGRLRDRPTLGSRAASDFVTSSIPSKPISREADDYFSSYHTSGLQTPADQTERKHIRFDDKVEQCIAVEAKDGEFDDDEEETWHQDDDDDESSDDGIIMMKRSKKKRPILQNKRTNSTADSKTIAKLPSTTLKYRTDSPDIPEHPPTPMWRSSSSSKLSPSPSQETLRPSHPSTNFLLAEEDDDEVDIEWEPSSAFAERHDSIHASQAGDKQPNSEQSGSGTGGLRRTSSGMFMPYEEDEDAVPNDGLLGRVVDTVNTAKDIAHVIWNVGWRR